MNNVVSLVPYYGGASRMVEVMRYLMESAHQLGCTKLVETMSGSGVISINRETIYFPQATLIEMDKGMATLLTAMTDPVLFSQFITRVKMMEPSPDRFRLYKSWKENQFSIPGLNLPLADIAEAQFYLSCLSRNGTQQGYKADVIIKDQFGTTTKIQKPIDLSNRLPSLYEVRRLLDGCTVYNDNCFNRILDYIHDEKCLIVIDPPFLESLRSCTGQYSYEWENVMHKLLLDVLTKETYTRFVSDEKFTFRDMVYGKKIKGEYIKDKPRAKVILFGFENEMYTKALTSAETPWYQFILKKPLLSSNKKTKDGEKELQNKSFWINFLPSDYAKTYVLELNHLTYLTPENLEERLKKDRALKEELIKKYGSKKRKLYYNVRYKVKCPDNLRLFRQELKKNRYNLSEKMRIKL